jgi:hypothetical protein
MTNQIDVHDLPKEQVKLVEDFVNFLRGRIIKKAIKTKGKKTIAFKSWPLGVKGKLTRREMYDYL